jgi:hypothetical protein
MPSPDSIIATTTSLAMATQAFQPSASSRAGHVIGAPSGPMASIACASGLMLVGTGMSRAGRWMPSLIVVSQAWSAERVYNTASP